MNYLYFHVFLQFLFICSLRISCLSLWFINKKLWRDYQNWKLIRSDIWPYLPILLSDYCFNSTVLCNRALTSLQEGSLEIKQLQSFYLQNLKSEQVLNQSLRIFTSLFNFAILMKCLFVRYWLQGCNPCWDIRQRRPVQKTREIQE